jgi:hypothetical protein
MQYGYKPGDGYKPLNEQADRLKTKKLRLAPWNKRFYPSPETERRLGVEADSVIARDFGVTSTAVGRYRKSHGIPAYKPGKKA